MLTSISLQNFRSYTKESFDFNPQLTVIVGPNTAGKTNLLEAIVLLSRGKSFRTDSLEELIAFGKGSVKIRGIVGEEGLEIRIAMLEGRLQRKYLVNGVSKRRVDFAGKLSVVLFAPQDLEIIIGSPGLRRNFLDSLLEQSDRDYRIAATTYERALRQRNALLKIAREKGIRSQQQFAYWDTLLVQHGQTITKKREECIRFFNDAAKDIFDFVMEYDRSEMSEERLLQYKDAEVAAGVTLVGPQRDDWRLLMATAKVEEAGKEGRSVGDFASRGQQRLAVLQLKMLELAYLENALGERPILLLDDIYSELDAKHIQHVASILDKQQTIMTTTHKEFIDKDLLSNATMIELA